jgi:hypothetical protein
MGQQVAQLHDRYMMMMMMMMVMVTLSVQTYGRESLVVKCIFVVEKIQNCLSYVCVNLSKQKSLFYVFT